ncbi:MAG: IS4 family transposase [Chloroflexota bacterium]|nr:IS4 family transposase [Chloroflexota bacterium]
MTSVAQIEAAFQKMKEELPRLARESGFLKRERSFDASQCVEMLLSGWLGNPHATLGELTQVAAEADVRLSAPGLHKRFTREAATFLKEALELLASQQVQATPVQVPLLRRFGAVIAEDSTVIRLPEELEEVWQGCGSATQAARAALKVHVRWNVLNGHLHGFALSEGRRADLNSPLKHEDLPEGSLYLSDLGYYDLVWLAWLHQHGRFWVERLKSRASLSDAQGKRIQLAHVLPRRIGQAKEMKVWVGAKVRQPARLLMLRVPDEVAEQRRTHLREKAADQGREVSEQRLAEAKWTMLITNVPAKRLSFADALVLLRYRWQMENLFKLWKQDGLIDEWRSANPWRILCEVSVKLMAMIVQLWSLQLGCWHDPARSLFKAAAVVRRHAVGWLEVWRGHRRLRSLVQALKRAMQSGCRLETRVGEPSAAQLLFGGLNWQLSP